MYIRDKNKLAQKNNIFFLLLKDQIQDANPKIRRISSSIFLESYILQRSITLNDGKITYVKNANKENNLIIG